MRCQDAPLGLGIQLFALPRCPWAALFFMQLPQSHSDETIGPMFRTLTPFSSPLRVLDSALEMGKIIWMDSLHDAPLDGVSRPYPRRQNGSGWGGSRWQLRLPLPVHRPQNVGRVNPMPVVLQSPMQMWPGCPPGHTDPSDARSCCHPLPFSNEQATPWVIQIGDAFDRHGPTPQMAVDVPPPARRNN